MPPILKEMEGQDNVLFNNNINYDGPIWQHDSETDTCMLCGVLFTFTRRKHHCRMCGKIFCGDCAKHRIPIPLLNNIIARVCLLCNKKSTKKSKEESPKKSRTISPSNNISHNLPPIVITSPDGGKYLKQNMKEKDIMNILVDDEISSPVTFVLSPNLVAMVKIIKISKFPGQSYWLLVTKGMQVIGQDEIVVVLERASGESVPIDLFTYLNSIYKEASFGTYQHHMTCSEPIRNDGTFFLFLNLSKLNRTRDVTDHHHHHHQAIDHDHHHHHPFQEIWEKYPFVPRKNFLLSIMMMEEEYKMTAMIPLRVMLRAACDQGYYPYPMISKRSRRNIFNENDCSLLENYLPELEDVEIISGLSIIIRRQSGVVVEIPRTSYNKVMRRINQNNDIIILFGDIDDDSCRHLVCVHPDDDDDDDGGDDSSNDKPLITCATSCKGIDYGFKKHDNSASFLIIERSTTPCTCSYKVVEDGVLMELYEEWFDRLKSSINNMEDQYFKASWTRDDDDDDCGGGGGGDDDVSLVQSFSLVWTDKEERINASVTSQIDGRSLEGVKSSRLQVSSDENGVRHLDRMSTTTCFQVQTGAPVVRWSEVFFLDVKIPEHLEDDFNLTGLVQMTGSTGCKVLQRHSSEIDKSVSSLGVRVSVRAGDKVLIEAGSFSRLLPLECSQEMEEVISQLVTSTMARFQSSSKFYLTLEFLFHVLSIDSTLRDCPKLAIN